MKAVLTQYPSHRLLGERSNKNIMHSFRARCSVQASKGCWDGVQDIHDLAKHESRSHLLKLSGLPVSCALCHWQLHHPGERHSRPYLTRHHDMSSMRPSLTAGAILPLLVKSDMRSK